MMDIGNKYRQNYMVFTAPNGMQIKFRLKKRYVTMFCGGLRESDNLDGRERYWSKCEVMSSFNEKPSEGR